MNLRKQVDTNRILDTDWRNYPGTRSRGRQVLQNLKRTEGETGAAEILFMLHGAVDIYYLSIYMCRYKDIVPYDYNRVPVSPAYKIAGDTDPR